MKSKAILFAFLILSSIGRGIGQTPSPCATDVASRGAEIQKLSAETDKLRAEKENFAWSRWISLLQNTVGIAAITIPILVVLRQLREQRISMRERAQVDASLKAAEIAMAAPTTEQVRNRAAVLGVLLGDLAPNFGQRLKDIDLSQVGFFSYRARLSTLLEAIAGHPEHALLITESYNTLFPDDDKNSKGKIAALLQYLKNKPKEEGM